MVDAHSSHAAPYVVKGPRAGDAIGSALRNAYCDTARLPDDMAALMVRLENCGIHTRS